MLDYNVVYTEQKPTIQDKGLEISIWHDGAFYNQADDVVLGLYKTFGVEFVKYLDGDFALVLQDKRNDLLVVSADVFATRPIWVGYCRKTNKVFTAGYLSTLEDSESCIDYHKVRPNTAYVYELSTGKLKQEITLYKFELEQNIRNYDRWIEAFAEAVYKRARRVGNRLFIGLSSGYDSGAIACELECQEIPFTSYSLRANESMGVIDARCQVHKNCHVFQMTAKEYDKYQQHIIQEGEDYEGMVTQHAFREKGNGFFAAVNSKETETITKIAPYNYKLDKASVGNAFVFETAKANGQDVLLCGQGADEIISDYGWKGRQRYSQSQFGGLFPADLGAIFPYTNFYGGTMDCYLTQAAYVGRLYGIEARFPFLDVDLVQAFLRLHPDFKNRFYKAPIHEYLTRNKYPFDMGVKKGFRANENLLPENNNNADPLEATEEVAAL